jgi:hypothetical protein
MEKLSKILNLLFFVVLFSGLELNAEIDYGPLQTNNLSSFENFLQQNHSNNIQKKLFDDAICPDSSLKKTSQNDWKQILDKLNYSFNTTSQAVRVISLLNKVKKSFTDENILGKINNTIVQITLGAWGISDKVATSIEANEVRQILGNIGRNIKKEKDDSTFVKNFKNYIRFANNEDEDGENTQKKIRHQLHVLSFISQGYKSLNSNSQDYWEKLYDNNNFGMLVRNSIFNGGQIKLNGINVQDILFPKLNDVLDNLGFIFANEVEKESFRTYWQNFNLEPKKLDLSKQENINHLKILFEYVKKQDPKNQGDKLDDFIKDVAKNNAFTDGQKQNFKLMLLNSLKQAYQGKAISGMISTPTMQIIAKSLGFTKNLNGGGDVNKSPQELKNAWDNLIKNPKSISVYLSNFLEQLQQNIYIESNTANGVVVEDGGDPLFCPSLEYQKGQEIEGTDAKSLIDIIYDYNTVFNFSTALFEALKIFNPDVLKTKEKDHFVKNIFFLAEKTEEVSNLSIQELSQNTKNVLDTDKLKQQISNQQYANLFDYYAQNLEILSNALQEKEYVVGQADSFLSTPSSFMKDYNLIMIQHQQENNFNFFNADFVKEYLKDGISVNSVTGTKVKDIVKNVKDFNDMINIILLTINDEGGILPEKITIDDDDECIFLGIRGANDAQIFAEYSKKLKNQSTIIDVMKTLEVMGVDISKQPPKIKIETQTTKILQLPELLLKKDQNDNDQNIERKISIIDRLGCVIKKAEDPNPNLTRFLLLLEMKHLGW